LGEPVDLASDMPEQKVMILYDDERQQEPKRLCGRSIRRHLLVQLQAVGEHCHRAVLNRTFNAMVFC